MEIDTHHNNDSTYQPVIFKKTQGSLVLTGEHFAFHPSGNGSASLLPYQLVAKHQVSPANYPKSLLKVILKDGKSLTFQLTDRQVLERIRKDISTRLRLFPTGSINGVGGGTNGGGASANGYSSNHSPNNNQHQHTLSGKKRSHAELLQRTSNLARKHVGPMLSMDDLDATALAVTRSSLLAANPSLRAQHKLLVEESKTVDEDDFWKTHNNLLQEEYAKICGMARAGTSSLLQSHLPLQGRVTLGVEEMRQIFILYPAVHKAYEEKVPLELSDEQFWRKYLESEYFHRDRGRLGTAARNHAADASKEKTKAQRAAEDQEARAAAVGTDDLFSRYDQKMREGSKGGAPSTTGTRKTPRGSTARAKKWGVDLAVGQFDLASTFQTERGQLLEGPRDQHPPNVADDGKGAKVIQKYNRHWAMVLHPEQAVAGSNLMDVARKSVLDVLEDDDDAKASGGLDSEMKRLVGFASAHKDDANHALGTGLPGDDDDPQEEMLSLKNVEAYYSGHAQRTEDAKPVNPDDLKRHAVFSQALSAKMKGLATKARENGIDATATNFQQNCFPPAELGKQLLLALTKKMDQDSRTNAATLEVVKTLPEDFKKKLHSFFRRSSELLRHFFGLRRLESEGQSGGAYSQKLKRIVQGMETFYREMEALRKEFPQTKTGELMRKMCLPIMDQLDWAFKLHRDGSSGGGGGGGFVTVEEL